MELTETDYNILKAIQSGRVESGTSPSHFVDYCDNEIGGDPRPLITEGYINADRFINGLTDKGTQAILDYEKNHSK
ncbi:hypothetical protein [Lentilactobacillus sp. SPB1-3]|uniref:Uncharacterized protein n=1 Tax=Lentilactobacillus terminaliae TaxID=3003483 RepID=A0ACD5DDP8_9LACO|nr:hypothetical protein [Lentilactobacillus sp. SPB1-3]MCZ0977898.1 hypothetical protein [Lentilactobacillus sp. SPB1-3]